MKVFIRPEINAVSTQGVVDIDKTFIKMSKPSNNKLLALYKKSFKLTDKIIEEQKLLQNENYDKLE